MALSRRSCTHLRFPRRWRHGSRVTARRAAHDELPRHRIDDRQHPVAVEPQLDRSPLKSSGGHGRVPNRDGANMPQAMA